MSKANYGFPIGSCARGWVGRMWVVGDKMQLDLTFDFTFTPLGQCFLIRWLSLFTRLIEGCGCVWTVGEAVGEAGR